MNRRLRRSPVLSAIAVCAILAGPVAAVQASDSSVRATIDAYNGRIAKDEARIVTTAAIYNKTHRPMPLVTALNHEVGDLRALQGKLAHESATTTRGRNGKNDVVKGLGLIATGYTALAKDVRAAGAQRPVSAAQVSAARSADRKGHNLVVAGLKLLST
jgi:hypothetical protein